jgi:DNA (cytosine-5)-methyltransferase 1
MIYKVVSLFSGCGGSDLGLKGNFHFLDKHYKANPIDIVYANDIDKEAAKTYEHNFRHSLDCRDIRTLDSKEIPNHDILVGGFPCQTFSMIGERKGFDDPRGELYLEMVRILKDKKPLCFIGENVKGLVNIKKGTLFKQILADFGAAGYDVGFQVLNAANFGVPQKRERVFIIGYRKDLNISVTFPIPTQKIVPLKLILETEVDTRYLFSEKAVEGLKNGNKAFNKGRVQNVDLPCNTINSHLAKVSLNGTDPVLGIDVEKDIYRRFTPLEAQRIQSFPDDFKFPVSEFQAYKQIGNAIPPVLMWNITQQVITSLSNINKKKKEKLVLFKENTIEKTIANHIPLAMS